jgi:hypothetical protein
MRKGAAYLPAGNRVSFDLLTNWARNAKSVLKFGRRSALLVAIGLSDDWWGQIKMGNCQLEGSTALGADRPNRQVEVLVQGHRR